MYIEKEPRLRLNKTSAVTLTTSWQTIDFDGASTYNINTFGVANNNDLEVKYNSGGLISFNNLFDKNFIFTLDCQVALSSLVTLGSVQLRFNIPNGVSSGVDINFPLPDTLGYTDIMATNLLSVMTDNYERAIYASSPIRTNGLKVQMKISNALLGTAILNHIVLNIQ